MSTVRRSALVLTALSALALTGCGPAEDDAAGGTGTTPTASPSATPSKTPSTPSTPSAGGSSSGGGSSADHDVFPCSTHDVTFTASLAEPTTSSYLLKVTNRSTKACRALGHPVVTFGDLDGQATERGTAPGIEDALRLEPGESAYAGLMGGADDGRGRTVGSIAMTMNTESDLEQTPLGATTPGLYVAPDTNSVTPWVNNVEDALSL
ncbi:DUF4232 domain-containing protein [Streptomyces phaeoluteigriseus]|uniref:DUF4232 domain-containing protein n=1 Tax=Streptomyces phaeoluteigriseus TaxID=114686 RepID=A0ABY4ZBW6_9ACTN|nr:DUF4232 domain-containing protein [Streptomyces phaeoluteigriseus]USQ86461.1 DUF4232 domain-containing protein [Streptomyces phaeoluteigriseus]